LFSYLADKITNYVSANTIKKDLGISDQTAKFYLQYLQDVYLIIPLYKSGRSHKITKSSIPKYYFNDTGILRLFSQQSRIGHLAKNAVFLELIRHSLLSEKASLYYDIIDSIEVDFKLNKSQLFECKYRKVTWSDLEKYESISDEINFIVSDPSSAQTSILMEISSCSI